ncbi:hypothetical protein H9Y04_41955 [Streptomyces sp. TRM66268-LWL]|uniref:Uncharacterized protein n=1 Tax=Streptomyces polyasparticus TaxID=2767826 RepID=A0ABR7SVZ1_9ACTN|nr:hypothetical protein [Streptomyces polyasparticus]MBC9719102.1 hypothetical protein [Streptomyces polyasparticus]
MKPHIPAALLATALAATAVALPAASAAAEPTPPPAAAGEKSAPVDGGIVKLDLDAKLLADLKAKGLILTQLTADCQVPRDDKGKELLQLATGLSLGVQAGGLATVDAKVAGNLELAKTCLGLVNTKAKTAVLLRDLKADLTAGAIVGTLADAKTSAEVKLGTFSAPKLTKGNVDVKTNSVVLDADVALDAAVAAKLNADLGVDLFVGGSPLLNVNATVSLLNDIDLLAVLGLKLDANVGAKIEGGLLGTVGGVLGGLLGGAQPPAEQPPVSQPPSSPAPSASASPMPSTSASPAAGPADRVAERPAAAGPTVVVTATADWYSSFETQLPAMPSAPEVPEVSSVPEVSASLLQSAIAD